LKGQLTIQYLISFIFFVGLITYIYFAFSSNIPKFIENVEKEDTLSKAFQVSEILVNDPGYPANWEESFIPPDQIKRLGLSDEHSNKTNLLLISKIKRFDSICDNDYTDIQKKLALNRSFSIFLFNITGNGNRECELDCQPPSPPKNPINVTIRRIVAFNDTRTNPSGEIKLAELIIQM